MTEQKVLFCTVGGSHEPILAAIRRLEPDHVVFFCTGRDPGTGRQGSCTQITGKGNVIKARRDDAAPTLPSIPVQIGLAEGTFEVAEVSADDLDGAFEAMVHAIGRMRQQHPQARLVTDYTGGTKTMSAALVVAALESGNVDLQLVTGNRADLVQVLPGTEYLAVASVERLRAHRAQRQALAAWERFAYDEAAAALERIAAPRDAGLAAEMNRARELSRAFAAWDRFEHAEALRRLRPYAPVLHERWSAQLGLLERMTGGHAHSALDEESRKARQARSEGLRLWDLWLNAQRRAAAGRYDDAIARLYRMIEWTAQWLLRHQAGLDTADLPAEKLPSGLVGANSNGKLQAGLFAAWELVAHHSRGAGARFIQERRDELLDMLKLRNHSILAHGFEPIGAEEWRRMCRWVERIFLPALREELAAVGQRSVFDQLPRSAAEAFR